MNYEDVAIKKCENGFCIVLEGSEVDEEGYEEISIKKMVCSNPTELIALLHDHFLEPSHPSDLS